MLEIEDEIIELAEESCKRIKAIEIFPYQKEHFAKVLNILQSEIGYLDVSSFGCGKTVIAIAVAVVHKMGILIVGPKTVLPTWEKNTKLYGVKLYHAMTYNALRGTEKGGVKHEFLTRDEDGFHPTKKLEELARNGLLIVFDECHSLKTEKSQQLQAAHAVSKEATRLARMGYSVRIAALSATPADRKENITSLFKILGIITSEKLYKFDRSTKEYKSLGLQEAINKCNRYDADKTFHAICRPINKTTGKIICHDLYVRVLKNHITSSMPEPPLEYKKDIKNYFAIMSPEDVERIKKGALLFASATSYKHETGEIGSSIQWGDVIRSRREIDSAKVNTIVRLAKAKMNKDPTRKIILYFTYKRDMEEAARQLKAYGSLVMNGDILKTEDRLEIMEKFQRNDNKYRVFISNPKIGSGIELDDQHGGRRRTMYLAPSYFFTDQFQATGRHHRKNTKSKATVRFIYSRDFPYEDSLLNSMATKSVVARDMLSENQNSVIFPGEIDQKIELREGEIEEE